MSIRTLVVDDEPMARERIVSLLAQEPDVDVVGQCSDGGEAVAAIQSLSPDLVFLDVQMPAADGFGVLRQIKPEQMPMVVFVTAYDEYALQAFEVHALDYLMKPFGRDRLQQSLAHARRQHEGHRAGGCSSCAPTRSSGSRRPATTCACTWPPRHTCSGRR